MWLIALAALPGFAQRQPSQEMLSSAFTVQSQSADEIVLSWQIPEDNNEVVHYAMLFVPAEIESATAVVTEFTWTYEPGAGPSQSGSQEQFPFNNSLNLHAPSASLRAMGRFSGYPIASLTLALPSLPNPREGRVHCPRGTVHIRFPALREAGSQAEIPRPPLNPNAGMLSKATDEIARNLFLNYPPSFPFFLVGNGSPISPHLQNPITKIHTRQEGIVQISADEILPASRRMHVDTLAVVQKNQTIPAQVLNAQGQMKTKGPLEASDRIRFFAPKSDSPYSPETVTWLSYNSPSWVTTLAPPPGPKSDDLLHQTLSFEEDVFFVEPHGKNEEQALFWMWHDLIAEGSPTVEFTVPQPARLNTATVELRVLAEPDFIAFTSETLRIELNQRPVAAQVNKMDKGFFHIRLDSATAALRSGTNTLILSLNKNPMPGRSEISLCLDRVDLHFQTEPYLSPMPFQSRGAGQSVTLPPGTDWTWWIKKREYKPDMIYAFRAESISIQPPIEDGEWDLYLVSDATLVSATIESVVSPNQRTLPYEFTGISSSMHEEMDFRPKSQADVIVLSPREWIPTLQSYLDSLLQEGFTAKAVAVEDVYDIFGDGRMDPHAIRAFLQSAFQQWPKPAPGYVLFVGDATWDYWGRYGNGVTNYIPAYREHDLYAAENWFARLETTVNDVPDVALGRWAVRSKEELAVVIEKTLRYKHSPKPGDWYNKVFLLTDDGFDEYSDELDEQWIPEGFRLTRRHITDYPLVDNIYLPERLRASLRAKTSLAATQDIIRLVNEGQFIWEYFGHGAPNVIGEERMFFGGGSKFSDAQYLTNRDKLPLFWAFTCETATFDYPKDKWNISIGEDMLTRPNGGIISLLGATGRGYPHEHISLARALHEAAFRYGFKTQGQIFLAACLIGLAQQSQFEPVNQFALLGDPTLPMPDIREVGGDVTADEKNWNYQWDLAEAAQSNSIWKTWRQGEKEFIADATHTIESNTKLTGTLPKNNAIRLGIEHVTVENGRIVISHGAMETPKTAAKPLIVPSTGKTPDVQFVPGSLTIEPAAPRSGESVFLKAMIANRGAASATDVQIMGFHDSPLSSGKPLEAVVGRAGAKVERLDPGEERPILVRWDPTKNTGNHNLYLQIDDRTIQQGDREKPLISNSVTVLRKADLFVDEKAFQITVSGNRLQLYLEVVNQGESSADRIIVELIAKLKGDDEPHSLKIPHMLKIAAGDRYKAGGIKLPATLESLEVVIDPDEVVDEESHDNNRFVYVHTNP